MAQNGGGVSTIGFSRTTTTTTTTRVGSDGGSVINYHYFKTVPGILKIVQIMFGIICIATATPVYLDGTYFFLIVCYTAAIITSLWIILIFFRLESKIPVNPSWPALEVIYAGAAFVLYAVAAAVQLSIYSPYPFNGYFPKPRSIVAGIFAVFNGIAYAVDAFYALRSWRSATTFVQRNGGGPVY